MTSVVSTLFIALDGVVEPDEVWHFPYFDEEMGAAVGDDYDGTDVLLLGRVTYDSFAGAWPEREAAGGEDAPFAALLGDLRKIVATHDDGDLGWRNVEATDDVVAAVRALKEAGDVSKVLIPGSISVVRQLLAAGLLDELRLLLHPATGGGSRLRLFADDDVARAFELVSATALPKGVVRLLYRVAEAPGERPDDAVAGEVPAG